MSKNIARKLLMLTLAAASLGLSTAGCSDDESNRNEDGTSGKGGSGGKAGTDKGGQDSVDGGTGAGGEVGNGAPVFGIGTLVSSAEVATDYLLLVPQLDHDGAELELDQAREFSGQSDLATHEGSVLVAGGEKPEITKYSVSADASLEAGKSVSFSNYGLTSAAFWNNQFVAQNKAYMLNGASEIVIWNPETMELEGTIELPELEAREGLRVVAGLADRSSVVHDGKFYVPLYWTDANYAQRSDDSVIVVIDVATDEVVSTITANCPGLDYATADDEGQLHFSNWTGGVGTHYVLGTAQNCIATVDPKSEEVTTKTFASLTGGHEGAAFKYAGNGRFVMSVFDEVRADIENAEDPFEPVAGTNWQLWSYDAATDEATPIEDVDWNSGAIINARIDDKFYSMVPGADYGSTVVYELDGTSAKPAFGIVGWSFRLFKVR